jgi:hypothetical protein
VWAVTIRSSTVLLSAGLLVGCVKGDTFFHRGPANYVEPKAVAISCPAPTLVVGGLNPAPDPGATCVKAVRDSGLEPVPPAPFGWIDLGEVDVGGVVAFAVPAGTASITLVEQWVSGGPDSGTVVVLSGGRAAGYDNAAVIGELRDPSSAVVYNDFHTNAPADGSGDLVFVGLPQGVTGTLTYPNTSASLLALGPGGVAPGDWTALVSDYAYECWLAAQDPPPPGLAAIHCSPESQRNDGRYRLFALTRPMVAGSSSPIPDRGVLDVAFHIVDATSPVIGIDAAGAVADPRVARMVETYGAVLANAGVCIGTVTFYDAPDWARSRFATGVSDLDTGACSNLSQLFTLSIPSARTLDLFLVSQILSFGTATTLGIDGSIPGPATVNGTVASGAVVSAEDLFAGTCPPPGDPISLATCGADLVGYVAAHESGHFLGLYHVTEADGAHFDPLSDTPQCACGLFCGFSSSECAAGLAASRCDQHYQQCSGGGNLMFWALSRSTSAGYLSPGQAQVVRTSPLLRSP